MPQKRLSELSLRARRMLFLLKPELSPRQRGNCLHNRGLIGHYDSSAPVPCFLRSLSSGPAHNSSPPLRRSVAVIRISSSGAQITDSPIAGGGLNMKTQHALGALAVSLTLVVRVASAASSPDFWIPYVAAPVTGKTGGKTGLFLIASKAVGGSTPPASATPATLIYAAKGSDGNQHLYGLDLADPSGSATAPKPVQITSLSVPASKTLCSGGQLQTKLTTPTTLAVVVYVATPEAGSKPGTDGYCTGVPDGKYYLATYGESDTTAPTVIDIPGGTSKFSALTNDGNFDPLNLNNGNLGGLLYWDSATQDENLYLDTNFTDAETLLHDIAGTPVACVEVPAVANGARNYLAGSALATAHTSGGFKSYQFVPSGEIFEFYDGQAAGCITDPDHLYFIGMRNGSTSSSLYEVSLTSITSSKTLLASFTSTASEGYSLIGANGSVVVFQKYSVSSAGAISTTVQTVPAGVASTKATSIGGPYSGALMTSFLSPAGGGSITGLDWLLLTSRNETVSDSTAKVTYTSEALEPNGSGTVMTRPPDTVFKQFGVFSTELDGTVLEITGITDTDGGFGGASLELLAIGVAKAPAKLTLSSGSSYKVPAGYEISVSGFYGTSVAAGGVFSLKGAPAIAVALDVSKHVMVPFSFTNTNVTPLL